MEGPLYTLAIAVAAYEATFKKWKEYCASKADAYGSNEEWQLWRAVIRAQEAMFDALHDVPDEELAQSA